MRSFGMVALEAMACGVPVVASETGGLAFLIHDGETGFHVPTGDASELANRLTLLEEDPVLRQRLGKQAAAYARAYAWPEITRQMIQVYESSARPGCLNASAQLRLGRWGGGHGAAD